MVYRLLMRVATVLLIIPLSGLALAIAMSPGQIHLHPDPVGLVIVFGPAALVGASAWFLKPPAGRGQPKGAPRGVASARRFSVLSHRINPCSGLGRRRTSWAHRAHYGHSFLGGDCPDYVALKAVCVDRLARFDQPN
jgi:hypothetical protein